jgi:hypothetical protein
MLQALNWADVLAKELDHVVLVKENRLQAIVRPSKKQLRRRGKRGWSVVTAIEAARENNGQVALPPALGEAVLQALTTLACGGRLEPGKPGKKKRAAQP